MPAPTVPADDIATLASNGPQKLVRHIVEHLGCCYWDSRGATGAAVSSPTRDLRLLEKIGLVLTDVDRLLVSPYGGAPRYTVDAKRVDVILNELRRHLLRD